MNESSVLQASHLSAALPDGRRILSDVSFSLQEGERLGIVGLSGAGKSTLLRTICGLLPPDIKRTGTLRLGEETDVFLLPERERRRYISRRISVILQDSLNSMNPFQTVGRQMRDTIVLHRGASGKEAEETALYWLSRCGFSDPAAILPRYAAELSGGMRQRVAAALSLCGGQRILAADEPMTALDTVHKRELAELLCTLCAAEHLSLLCVSHDLAFVYRVCSAVMVIDGGRCVERGKTEDVFRRPQSAMARRMTACEVRLRMREGSA